MLGPSPPFSLDGKLGEGRGYIWLYSLLYLEDPEMLPGTEQVFSKYLLHAWVNGSHHKCSQTVETLGVDHGGDDIIYYVWTLSLSQALSQTFSIPCFF